jgi:hypothetical protein
MGKHCSIRQDCGRSAAVFAYFNENRAAHSGHYKIYGCGFNLGLYFRVGDFRGCQMCRRREEESKEDAD